MYQILFNEICMSFIAFLYKTIKSFTFFSCTKLFPPVIHNFHYMYMASVYYGNKYTMVINNRSKGNCVSLGGERCSIDQKPPFIKRCTTRLTSIICLNILNRSALFIYSNVLNFVPNHRTMIFSLVGYYGFVLLFGQICVLCFMSFVA